MRKSVSQDLIKSHKLLVRCGMVSQLGSGLFSWLPLGLRLMDKIQTLVHKHHERMGFNRCLAPVLHPANLWKESGRYDVYGLEMMRFKDRHTNELILGPTAEEAFVDMVRQNVNSSKELPIHLYNIQWKFRDEIRPRFGIMRCREFLMCDAYSFHMSDGELASFYKSVLVGYLDLFKALGFTAIPLEQSDTGEIGGSTSHEFFALAETGENEIQFDGSLVGQSGLIKGRGIELGHIFALGSKYTESMKFRLDGVNPVMGCYGVGVSRLAGAALEIFGQDDRVNYPAAIAPFQVHLFGSNPEIAKILHDIWPAETYYDDRARSFGEHNAVAMLLGAPHRIIVGDKKVGADSIQINQKEYSLEEAIRFIKALSINPEFHQISVP